MVAEAEIICQQSIPPVIEVQYHLHNLNVDPVDVTAPSTPIFETISTDISRFESVRFYFCS